VVVVAEEEEEEKEKEIEDTVRVFRSGEGGTR